MTVDQQLAFANLTALGFTSRQSEFLYLVGTNTGVFTAEHYRRFCGILKGKAQTAFFDKLDRLAFTHRITFNRTQLFHLKHKTFYNAIMCTDSRLRRSMSMSLVRTRLQYLDYIVTYAANNFVGTENDKVALFRDILGLPISVLPSHEWTSRKSFHSTLRYFPERFPVFISGDASAPKVGIVYGEDPEGAFTSCRRFISSHQAFLNAIPHLHVAYISPWPRRRSLAQGIVTSLFGTSNAVKSDDLQRYFLLRQRLEDGQGSTWAQEDYAFWTSARKLYSAPQYEDMYVEFQGTLSLPAVSSASPGRSLFIECFRPFTRLEITGRG